MTTELPTSFDPLKQQLLAAAESFSADAQPLGDILSGLVDDVERACREPLEIFPVCHHSPASAVQMVERLRRRPPRAIYMECCEDLRPLLDGLRDCKLPVALQAFAPQSEALPSAWTPLNLVCPLTEFSAEFQAIAYALEHPETELHFVDRSADHFFQWLPQDRDITAALAQDAPTEDDDDAAMHGSAIGVEMGSLAPSFEAFRHFLLKNAHVQHFSEWWDQYVEEALTGHGYDVYRQVMFLIGSLFRRLGTTARDREEDEQRERFMWTRMKQHLQATRLDPGNAIYICGAAHSASRVAEFGIESPAMWDIPPQTDTAWLYGLLPSSYSAIEHQFGHPHGTVTLAEARWRKALRRRNTKAFSLAKKPKAKAAKKPAKAAKPKSAESVATPAATPQTHPLLAYLQQPPALIEEDETELLQHCVRIVDLARRNGYLATTADSIAVYHTAILLANLRHRKHPTPYDFRDAAITCIEKESAPRKRDIARLCDILLGGDKTGQIGYASLPPLAQDVYERLSKLPIKLDARTIQRALLDFRSHPEYLPCSELLWRLRYLLPGDVARPIMGQCELGHTPQQESWDVAIGKYQGSLIQLGYEGVTVEYVLERRLKKAAFGPESRTVDALQAAEDSLLLLKSSRLTEELGRRAITLLVSEPDAQAAQAIYARLSRFIHYYRSTEAGLPAWCQDFVATGYTHYVTLLPNAFSDRGVKPEDLTSMLQFIFTLESLALSLGCERSQLVIAIKQARPETSDFPKQALLWSAECILQLRELTALRALFNGLLENELILPSLPAYLGGFLLALSFTPLVAGLTVELMSKAFEKLPDHLLMPWLPRLIMMLRPHATSALPTLVKEAATIFPPNLKALETWRAPWSVDPQTPSTAPRQAALDPNQGAAQALLRAFPSTTNALASGLGVSPEWTSGGI